MFVNKNKKRLGEKMKKSILFGFLLIISGATFAAVATNGPFIGMGGQAATPSKFIVTLRSLEFRKTTGEYIPFVSGAFPIDLGDNKVPNGGTGGFIGQGLFLNPGTYDKMRITVARYFTMNGSATNVSGCGTSEGPSAYTACSTGGSGNTTDPFVNFTFDNAIKSDLPNPQDQVLSVPPQADDFIKNYPLPNGKIEVLDSGDIQITADILPNGFTIPPGVTTLPDISIGFNVANTLEFLNPYDDAENCYGLVLPPMVTIELPGGASILFAPVMPDFTCTMPTEEA